MRKSFIALTFASLGLATAAVLSPSAIAGTAGFTVDPDSGAPGSTFTASGNNCLPPSQVRVTLHKGASDTSDPDVFDVTTPNSDGIWSLELTVPTTATAGEKAVSAHCEDLSQTAPQNARNNARNAAPNAALPQQTFDYLSQSFTVIIAATASPTPSPSPSTPPAVAPAADAVDEDPNFTG
jgi:hypothetical protein